jgi:hypothetical protein
MPLTAVTPEMRPVTQSLAREVRVHLHEALGADRKAPESEPPPRHTEDHRVKARRLVDKFIDLARIGLHRIMSMS